MLNNREFTRSAFTMGATLFPKNGKEVTGEISNVSLYGLFLKTKNINSIEMKKTHPLLIHLSGENSELTINSQASVVHVDDRGMGIHIESLTVDSFLHWKNFVTYASGDCELVEKEFSQYIRKHLLEKN